MTVLLFSLVLTNNAIAEHACKCTPRGIRVGRQSVIVEIVLHKGLEIIKIFPTVSAPVQGAAQQCIDEIQNEPKCSIQSN